MTQAIFDFSNIAHAIWYSSGNVDYSNCSDEAEVGLLLYEVVTKRLEAKINALLSELKNPEPMFVLDNFSSHKSDLYPRYKMNRHIKGAKPIQLLEQWAIEKFPNMVCSSAEHEADDVIATLCTLAKEQGKIVISADRDMWQLLDEKIKVYCPFKHRFIDTQDIEHSFNLTNPCQIVLHKSCWGDAGDNIPNIMPRMQKQVLPVIRMTDGTLDKFVELFENNWNGFSQRCRNLYHASKQQLAINYQIVKLATDCPITWH